MICICPKRLINLEKKGVMNTVAKPTIDAEKPITVDVRPHVLRVKELKGRFNTNHYTYKCYCCHYFSK